MVEKKPELTKYHLDVVLMLGSIIPVILLFSECSFHCLPVGRLISKLNRITANCVTARYGISTVLNS